MGCNNLVNHFSTSLLEFFWGKKIYLQSILAYCIIILVVILKPIQRQMLRYCSLKKRKIFDLVDLEIYKMAAKRLKWVIFFIIFRSATNWIGVYG